MAFLTARQPLMLLLLMTALLSGCMSQPINRDDACAVLDQRDGWFNNWYRQTKRVEKEFGVPVHVLMATINQESSYRARARPPRRRLLGFIPWKRPSTAYGYSQALTSTWQWYQEDAGRPRAKRDRYKDAVHFVGWYHDQSHRRNGIAKHDMYNLYLAYYAGHGGYARGTYRSNPAMTRAAGRARDTAARYQQQLRACGRG